MTLTDTMVGAVMQIDQTNQGVIVPNIPQPKMTWQKAEEHAFALLQQSLPLFNWRKATKEENISGLDIICHEQLVTEECFIGVQVKYQPAALKTRKYAIELLVFNCRTNKWEYGNHFSSAGLKDLVTWYICSPDGEKWHLIHYHEINRILHYMLTGVFIPTKDEKNLKFSVEQLLSLANRTTRGYRTVKLSQSTKDNQRKLNRIHTNAVNLLLPTTGFSDAAYFFERCNNN